MSSESTEIPANRRALIMNASAMGVLIKSIADTVGIDHGRGIMTRYGYACGYEDAMAFMSNTKSRDIRQLMLAGPRMHTALGHVKAELLELKLGGEPGGFRVLARWQDSYEAQQHRQFLGKTTSPTCWGLSGYASGWTSAVLGEKALAIETQCEGAGAGHCLVEIRKVADWGDRARGAVFDLEGINLHHETSVLERATRTLEETDKARRESEGRYQAILDFAADMIWVRDLSTGAIIEVNAAMARKLGYSRTELLGRPIFDFIYNPEDRRLAEEFAQRAEQPGAYILQSTLRSKDGTAIGVELRGSIMEFQGRKALLVVARDLNEQVRDQRMAAALYEAFRRSNDVMFYCDRNGIILDVNDAFTRIYGWTRSEVIGRSPSLLRSKHSTEELYRRMWSQILDPMKSYWKGEIINKAKDGREIPVILTITAVRGAEGRVIGYISNAMDISDQVSLRSKLAHSEALASLGEMAAVVAHEIRNPLGSIVMAAKQLSGGNLSRSDRDLVMQVLKDESQRLGSVLTNFLSYARPREVRLSATDINALVSEIGRIIQSNNDLIKDIRVRVSTDPGLAPFPVDSDQIRQVIWNIVLNAVQAMEGSGALTIETGRSGENAFFRVTDTGPGIPQNSLASIFKPFHSTKRQGTGLGLAIAERIVKAHGGAITVDTRPGETSFLVTLPAYQG